MRPTGALVTNASPPNRQAASGTAIACLTREDLRTLDTLICFSSLWIVLPGRADSGSDCLAGATDGGGVCAEVARYDEGVLSDSAGVPWR